jgi:sugar phosphate isomerase/epimerase
MRLGVVGVIPNDFDLVDDARAAQIAAYGVTGVGAHIGGDPHEMSPERVRRLRDVLANHGIRIVQFWGWYPSIITPDDATRRTGIDHAQRIVELGVHAGAAMIGIRPTSMSPNGAWSPHRDNFTPAAEDRLVDSLTEIARVGEANGLPLALECHVTTTLNSPQSVRRVIERTGSQWIKVNIDPVNFIPDFATAYHTTGLLHDLFATLGEYAASAHVKDVVVGDDLVVHIDEAIPGRGILDFDTFFSEFEAYLPNGYAFVEHLQEPDIPEALAFVRRKLGELGIAVKS